MFVSVLAAAAVIFTGAAVRAAGDEVVTDWPNWRGPNHDGVSTETGWQTNWQDKKPKQLWKKHVGVGYSSVAVVGDRVYTMGNKNNTDTVWCLNADTGEEVWKHSYPCPKQPKGGYPGPRATPTVDGKNVYTFSHNGQVFCLNAVSGDVVWKKDVRGELKAGVPQWGLSGSPLVAGKLLILNIGAAGTALDKATGEIVWKTGGGMAGYATPAPFEMGGRKCVAIFSATFLAVQDAKSGKGLGRYPWKTGHNINAATPIISGDKMFISSDYGKGCALLRIGSGKLTAVWQNKKMRNHFTNCMLWKGHLYGFDRSGFKCLDFATGQVKWTQKGFGRESSLMIADGKMIIMEQRGTLVVAEPSPSGYKELARTKALSGTCWTVPVLSGGRIFCRNHQGKLVCLKVGPKPKRAKPVPAAATGAKKTPTGSKSEQAERVRSKLSLARAYLKAGLRNKAKSLLEEIIRNYKDSQHAPEARKLLESINK